MQRYQDNSDQSDARATNSWTPLILAAPGIVLLVIVTLVASSPRASEWISAAVQAEFVNPDITSVGPTQIAQPAEEMRIVRSN